MAHEFARTSKYLHLGVSRILLRTMEMSTAQCCSIRYRNSDKQFSRTKTRRERTLVRALWEIKFNNNFFIQHLKYQWVFLTLKSWWVTCSMLDPAFFTYNKIKSHNRKKYCYFVPSFYSIYCTLLLDHSLDIFNFKRLLNHDRPNTVHFFRSQVSDCVILWSSCYENFKR